MREESHLDEMRSAIRGDFERLAERRGDQELMRVTDEVSPDEPVDLAAEAAADAHVEPVADVAPETEVAPEVAPEDEPEPEPRRSWLARVFSPP